MPPKAYNGPRLTAWLLGSAVAVAAAMVAATGCDERKPVGPNAEGNSPAALTEIRDAPDQVWCVSLTGGRLGEPRRSPGGAPLSWTFAGNPDVHTAYVECFPLETRYGKDVELTDQIAGYVREDVTTTLDFESWTRYRKVPFEEARTRHRR